jgi:hypothetical protein
MQYIGSTPFNGSKLTSLAVSERWMVAAGLNGREFKVAIWGVAKSSSADGVSVSLSKPSELSVSSPVTSVRLCEDSERGDDLIAFTTDTRDLVFLGSPAQLHSLEKAAILRHGARANDAVDSRTAMVLSDSNHGGPRFPDDDGAYITLSDDAKRTAWRRWGEARIIRQIEPIRGGVAFFADDAKQFELVRCDTERVIEHARKGRDAAPFVDCQRMRESAHRMLSEAFRCEDGNGRVPPRIRGLRCSVRMPRTIKRLQTAEGVVLVIDDAFVLSVHSDFGALIETFQLRIDAETFATESCALGFDIELYDKELRRY